MITRPLQDGEGAKLVFCPLKRGPTTHAQADLQ